MTIIP